ncbi:MAG: YHYH protein [Planktotalea sp.]|uniref:YHYH protein n=1 Tax=Planktotalea sp. TaxID=2029877 RepID=UPI003C72C852
MKSVYFLALATCLATPAFSDAAGDRLAGIAHFFENARVLAGPNIVDCKLSKGTQTKCFAITVKAEPKDYTPGPWCPTSITDGPDKSGVWLEGGAVLDVDGDFITNLPTLYGDDTWQLFDPATGKVRVTDSKAACKAAARPDVDPAYNNYCVECLPEYMPEDASITYVIPLAPQRTWFTNRAQPAGVANNGVRLDGPAPVDAILAAHTIAPFDDCGGHVNTHVGYHYHIATDCLKVAQIRENHAGQIGIAMDGFGIFTHLLADGTAPDDLDKCNGHEAATLGYHYHAGAAGSNAILSCLRAETGCALEDGSQTCDATVRPPRP